MIQLTPIRYLARAFVDAQSVAATPGEAMALAAKLQGVAPLFPQQVNEATATGVQRRVALISPTLDWQVALLSESFDVVRVETQPGLSSTLPPIETFAQHALTILTTCTEHFGRVPHRLAFVVEALSGELDTSELRVMAPRLLKLLPSYAGTASEPIEWEHRVVRRDREPLDGAIEELNVIVAVGRYPGVLVGPMGQRPTDRLRVEVDVNTIPTVTRGRFTSAGVGSFMQVATSKVKSLQAEVLAAVGEAN